MNNKTKAIIFVLICTCTSDIGAFLTKYILLESFTPMQTIFMRTGIRIIPLLFIIPFLNGFTFKTKIPFDHFYRCALGASTAFLLTYGTKYVSLAESTVIGYMVPVFFSILCCSFFQEKMTVPKASVIGISFFGVLVSMDFNADSFHVASIAIFIAALFSAMHRLFIKKVSQIDHPILGNFYMNIFLLSASCLSLFLDDWSALSLKHAPILLVLGSLSFLTQFLSSKALSICEGSILAPIDYISFITVIVLEYFIQSVVPGLNVIVGGLMIIGANLYHLKREVLNDDIWNDSGRDKKAY